MGTQKDWVGTRHSVFVTLGASNHTEAERAENDYYATEPLAADLLLEVEQFDGSIWENACGEGHLSERFKEAGYDVISTDLIDRGYGKGNVDFYACQTALGDNIVTNPPYKKVVNWVWHCLELLEEGKKCALFLPIQFLESKERIALFKEHPPKVVYVCANRVLCAANGQFYKTNSDGSYMTDKRGERLRMQSAKCYAWFVWIKGFKGDPIIKWINT